MSKRAINTNGLSAFIHPRSVAVIGASETTTPDGAYRVGTGLIKNLIEYPRSAPGCTVYPINPKRDTIFGVPCYPDLSAVPSDEIDIVVYAVASKKFDDLVDTIRVCHEKKVRGIVMISAGFAEAGAGEAGKERLRRLLEALGDIRLIGPNCLGFASRTGFNATFLCEGILPGPTAFISQSGGMTVPPASKAVAERSGLSFLASFGAGVDAALADWMAFAAEDPHTKSVVIYTETVTDPHAFMEAARRLVKANKPIALMKPGRTEIAAKAAASHSGSLAGGDDVFSAALERAGVIRVNTVEELYNVMNMFRLYGDFAKLDRDQQAGAFLSHAGGQGVIFADAIGMSGGKLSVFSEDTMARLNADAGTDLWSKNNPVDIVGDADIGRFDRMIRILMDAPEVHWLVLNWDPICTVRPDKVAELVVKIRKDYPNGKPIVVSIMGGDDWMSGDGLLKLSRSIIRDADIPHIENPDAAASAVELLLELARIRSDNEAPSRESELVTPEKKRLVDEIICLARNNGRAVLDTSEVLDIFRLYGIHTVPTVVAKTETDVDKNCKKILFPVAVKLFSKTEKGSHKTDVGGVKLNVKDIAGIKTAYREIRDAVIAKIGIEHFQGVVIQPMARSGGYEVLLGKKTDTIWGPALIFGWGGTDTEIIRDSIVTLPGLNAATALRLIEQTKIWKKLRGARGKKAADIGKVVDAFVTISRLAEDFPEIDELDINPLLAFEDSILVVDGRITLHPRGKERDSAL